MPVPVAATVPAGPVAVFPVTPRHDRTTVSSGVLPSCFNNNARGDTAVSRNQRTLPFHWYPMKCCNEFVGALKGFFLGRSGVACAVLCVEDYGR